MCERLWPITVSMQGDDLSDDPRARLMGCDSESQYRTQFKAWNLRKYKKKRPDEKRTENDVIQANEADASDEKRYELGADMSQSEPIV